MREVVDQLIEERAPWLRRRGPAASLARPIVHGLLKYERTVKVGEALEPLPGAAALQSLYELIAQHVEITGLENIPRNGPAMVVCNHPTGIADGVVLFGALSEIRPDLFIFANADAHARPAAARRGRSRRSSGAPRSGRTSRTARPWTIPAAAFARPAAWRCSSPPAASPSGPGGG